MDKDIRRKNLHQTSIISYLQVPIKEEISDEEYGSEEVNDAFVCEFCDDKQHERFSSRDSLISHCLKSHQTACLGCFEMFGSLSDLLEHQEAFPHEPPVCRDCCLSFGSAEAKVKHKCVTGSKQEKDKSDLIRSTDKKTQGPENDSESSDEDESDFEIKYVPESSSGEEDSFDDDDDDNDDDDDDDNDDGDDAVYGYSACKKISNNGQQFLDVPLNCVNCSFVARGFWNQPSFKIIRNHTASAHPTACCICFENFENTEALNLHEESLKHKIWRCGPCGFVTVTSGPYTRHQIKFHADQCKFQCPKCSDRFFVQAQLDRHLVRIHKVKKSRNKSYEYSSDDRLPTNICTICDYSAETSYAIVMHMFQKHPEPNQLPMFTCNECQLGFCRPGRFGRHIRENHDQDPEFRKIYRELLKDFLYTCECEPCCKRFNCRNRYMKHLRVIHPLSMPHHCSICNLGYLDPYDLKLHECREHKNVTSHVCDKCEKSFKDLNKLVTHFVKVHEMTTVPSIYCYIHKVGFCSYRWARTHLERYHKKKQSLEIFQCKICGKCVSSKHVLANHEAGHLSERPFKCSTCGRAYASAGLLKHHESTHSLKQECQVCGKKFHSKLFLKRHAVVHTGEKPFECSICGLRVSQNSALKRHMDKVHPGGIMGKPRSTKPRKCRVLSKTLEKQKEIASDKCEDAEVEEPAPSPGRSQKHHPKATVEVQRNKKQPNLSAGRRGRKRQRKAMSSEESSSEDEDGISSSVAPTEPAQRNTETAEKSPKQKKRKRKSKPWSRVALSSTDDEDKSSESDDGSDTPYLPNVNESRNRATRRSSRLNQ